MKRAIWQTLLSIPGIHALKWRSLPPALYCFNYHRIGNPADCPYDRDVFSCTGERFEQHVRFLQERFDLLAPENLNDWAHGLERRTRPAALITFDDGYLDNYSIAFPILQKLRAPALFFFPTAFIGTNRLPWWDEVAWCLRHARRPGIRLQGGEVPFSLSPREVDHSIRQVLFLIKSRPLSLLDEQLAEIRGGCDPYPRDSNSAPVFLNWDQAREMLAGGMSIGSHTHTHPILSNLDASSQEQELRHSKAVLEDQLQATVIALAYPDGGKSTYNQDTLDAVRRAGYRLAFNYTREVNTLPLHNPFELSRLAVAENISASRLQSLACFPGHFS